MVLFRPNTFGQPQQHNLESRCVVVPTETVGALKQKSRLQSDFRLTRGFLRGVHTHLYVRGILYLPAAARRADTRLGPCAGRGCSEQADVGGC